MSDIHEPGIRTGESVNGLNRPIIGYMWAGIFISINEAQPHHVTEGRAVCYAKDDKRHRWDIAAQGNVWTKYCCLDCGDGWMSDCFGADLPHDICEPKLHPTSSGVADYA